MTVLVGRRESFNAAHQLYDPGLSDDENRRLFGKCANLHGHNYILEVVVAGEIDQASGYVLDLKLLSDVINTQVIRDVDQKSNSLYGTSVFPETFIIDRNGVVRRKFIGAVDWTEPEITDYLSKL